MVEFKIKNNKVSCVIFINHKNGRIGYVGRAKCSPNDDFNEEFGKDLAYKRALLKLKKAETAEHNKGIKSMRYWIEPQIRRYQHHLNAYKHNAKRVSELKQEIEKMLGNE